MYVRNVFDVVNFVSLFHNVKTLLQHFNLYWSIFLPWYLYFDLSKESLYFCHLWIWFVFISNVHKIRPFLFNIRFSVESYKSK